MHFRLVSCLICSTNEWLLSWPIFQFLNLVAGLLTLIVNINNNIQNNNNNNNDVNANSNVQDNSNSNVNNNAANVIMVMPG